MKNEPVISIITISYNAVSSIEQTILSVINQTYPNIEYLIIDGGSTDGTVDIIKRYEDKISYWVSEPDKGIYDAMNKGIEVATGEWINFMNCGDSFYNENNIKNIFSHPISNTIKVIYGNVVLKNTDKVQMQKASTISNLSYMMPFCHQSSFIRSEIAKENKFNLKYKIAADYNCMYTIYYKYGENAFKYKDECISIYDMTDSFSLNNPYKHWLEYLEIRSSHKNIRWYYDYIKKIIKETLRFNNK